MMKLNEFHLKAAIFGLKNAKIDGMIAAAEHKTLLEIGRLCEAGLLTPEETILLLDEMWGDSYV